MSYVDGTDNDYRCLPEPPEEDKFYSYETSANTLEFGMVSTAAPDDARQEESYLSPEAARTVITTLMANEPREAPWQGLQRESEYWIQKWATDAQADPSKLDSLKCFGPPTTAPDVLERPTWPPFPEQELEINYPATPEDLPEKGLPRNPFATGVRGAPEWVDNVGD
ncbi:hypothetical protein [Bradyrhizobium sp. 169]|uniref:hypothetical protein n=1 Tax=Bradyrhizobium sp. 169 TaxID=2782640 RepID=UPI001FF74632|nr:hypothetical protein [Bradyrhizobium sp. 169]MCK1586917.1 hypothetical protein [Bradyrhizobium sp. 169]